MVMKRLFTAVAVVATALLVVSSSQGEEKNKGAAVSSSSAKKPQGVWKDVTTGSPDTKVSYKIDGTYIVIKFKNLSKTKPIRIKYQAKWKNNVKGKWVGDASAEGLSTRLKKQDEITKEVRTHSKDIKDVVIIVEVTEGS
jgi:hypothetical protein